MTTKLTVYVEDTRKNKVSLDKAIETYQGDELCLKTASVFWNYNNVSESLDNNYILINTWRTSLSTGYYTFGDIKETLKAIGITATHDKVTLNGTIKVTSGMSVNLKKFGLLLGFDENTVIGSSVGIEGKNMINVNGDLRYFSVHCDIVDTDANFNIRGQRSTAITTLPITTKQSLKGSVTHYTGIESKVPIKRGWYGLFEFHLLHDIGLVLMELYLQ